VAAVKREHYEDVLTALDQGLDLISERSDRDYKSLLIDKPTFIEGLPPPHAIRAIVTFGEADGTVVAYEVVMRPTTSHPSFGRDQPYPQPAESECSKSTHGKHTPVNGECIGCGEKVS
jgi:hypothetical protein